MSVILSPDVDSERRGPQVTGATKAVLLVSSMMTVMAGAIISPSLPGLREHFSDVAGIDVLAPLVLTIVALSIIIFAPVVGLLSDRFGGRRVYLFSLLLYAIGGTGGLYLNSVWLLLASRIVLGAGVAGIATCTLALAGDYFEGDVRNRFIGLITAFMALGGVLFSFLGGFLAEAGWRYPYLLYAIPLLLLPVAFMALPEPKSVGKSHACESGETRDVTVSVRWQTVGLIYCLVFAGMVLFYLMPTQLPFFLKSIGIGSAILAGNALTLMGLGQVGSTLWYRHAGFRINKAYLIPCFFLLTGIAYLILSFVPTYAGSLCSVIIMGLGMGYFLALCNTWINEIAPDASRGKLVGGLNTALYAGQFLSPVFASPIVLAFGYGAPFGLYACVGAFCLVVCIVSGGVFLCSVMRK